MPPSSAAIFEAASLYACVITRVLLDLNENRKLRKPSSRHILANSKAAATMPSGVSP